MFDMAYVTVANPAQSDLMARVQSVFASAKEANARRQMYNKTLSELQTLSRHELADLGLSQSSLRSVAYETVYLND